LFAFCSSIIVRLRTAGDAAMVDQGLDAQSATVLALGWLVTLWLTLC
jgi:hypothetical protein